MRSLASPRSRLVLVAAVALAAAGACSSGSHATGASSGTGATATGMGGSGGATSGGSTGGTGSGGGSDAGAEAGFTGNPGGICPPVTAGGDLTMGPFPAPAAAGAGVSFRSDWSALPAGGGYRYTQMMDGCRMQLDGTRTWHDLPALRVEVRPGDDPLGLGSERAEALIMQDGSGALYENTTGGTQYFATSYYFPAGWDGTALQGDAESWSAVFQIYGASALGAGKHTMAGPQVYTLYLGPPGGTDQAFDFSSTSIALGSWTDLVLAYTWATTPTGHVTVWRRDQGQTAFQQVLDVPSVVTLPTADPTAYYWKQGLYRGPHVGGRIDVLWIGPTARGTSFAAVEKAAFGTAAGP